MTTTSTEIDAPRAQRLGHLGRAARALAARALPMFSQRGDGPPDLDELWRDFNRKLTGLFGRKGGGEPDRKSVV